MARLPRPHIPLSVKIEVAERQLKTWPGDPLPNATASLVASYTLIPNKMRLEGLLTMIAVRFGCEVDQLRLDHDPALVNRLKLIQPRTGRSRRAVYVPEGAIVLRYIPDANDPEHLFYRPHIAHDIKTRVRGDHGQLSDLALARKERRRVKKAKRKPTKWPKGRKLRSRPFTRKTNEKR